VSNLVRIVASLPQLPVVLAAPALTMGSQTGGIQPLFDKLSKMPEDGPGMAAMALVAVNGLSSVVRRGGPFNDVHQKMADLLRTMMDKTGQGRHQLKPYCV